MIQRKKKNNYSKNNYFKQNIQKYGQDFIQKKKIEKGGLLNEPPRIFRDLIRNRIDLDEYNYFYDPDLQQVMLENAESKFREFSVLYNAMNVLFYHNNMNNFQPTQDEFLTFNKVKHSYELYRELYNSLYNFRISGDISWITKIPFNITNKSLVNFIN